MDDRETNSLSYRNWTRSHFIDWTSICTGCSCLPVAWTEVLATTIGQTGRLGGKCLNKVGTLLWWTFATRLATPLARLQIKELLTSCCCASALNTQVDADDRFFFPQRRNSSISVSSLFMLHFFWSTRDAFIHIHGECSHVYLKKNKNRHVLCLSKLFLIGCVMSPLIGPDIRGRISKRHCWLVGYARFNDTLLQHWG